MTTVEITLPDQLAEEAKRAGLLTSERMEQMLREELRNEALECFRDARAKLEANPLPPMTPDEVQAEIDAYRSEKRRATGT